MSHAVHVDSSGEAVMSCHHGEETLHRFEPLSVNNSSFDRRRRRHSFRITRPRGVRGADEVIAQIAISAINQA